MATRQRKWKVARGGDPGARTKTPLVFLMGRYRALDDGEWRRQGHQPTWVADAIQRHNTRLTARQGVQTLGDIDRMVPLRERWAYRVALLLRRDGYEVDPANVRQCNAYPNALARNFRDLIALPRRWPTDRLARRSYPLLITRGVTPDGPYREQVLVLHEHHLPQRPDEPDARYSAATILRGSPAQYDVARLTLLRIDGDPVVYASGTPATGRHLTCKMRDYREAERLAAWLDTLPVARYEQATALLRLTAEDARHASICQTGTRFALGDRYQHLWDTGGNVATIRAALRMQTPEPVAPTADAVEYDAAWALYEDARYYHRRCEELLRHLITVTLRRRVTDGDGEWLADLDQRA